MATRFQFVDDSGETRLAGFLVPEPGGSSAVLMSSTTLTSAQLKALDVTPVTLLAAPGGRFYYAMHDVILHYRFGTTPYDAASTGFRFCIGYGATIAAIGGAGQLFFPLARAGIPQDFFTQTEDAYVLPPVDSGNLNVYGWLATSVENKALSVAITNVDGALTSGDGTLTIRLFYSLIDGAP